MVIAALLCSAPTASPAPPALLRLSLPSVSLEGYAFEGVAIIAEPLSVDLTVTLSSSDVTELLVVSNTVISAGATTAVFQVSGVPDGIPDGPQPVTFTARAPGHLTTNATVLVWDSEISQHPSPDILWMSGGHMGEVNAVAFSPDGALLASAADDATIKLWQVPSGNLVRTLVGHGKDVRAIAFSPDGRQLVSASKDDSVRMWNVSDGRQAYIFGTSQPEARTVAFSPDGKIVASAGGNQEENPLLILWDATNGVPRQVLTWHTREVRAVTFSPDGLWLASAGLDATIILWQVGTNGTVSHVRSVAAGSAVHAIAFAPDGQQLAAGMANNSVTLWRIGDGALLRTLTGHTDSVRTVAFTPDGSTVVSGSWDSTIKHWNAATGALLQTTLNGERVRALALSGQGTFMASGDKGSTVKLWPATGDFMLRQFTENSTSPTGLSFSPDNRLLACATADGNTKVWQVQDHALLLTAANCGQPLAISANGTLLAGASRNNIISVWRLTDGALLWSLTGHTETILALGFSGDAQLVSVGADESIRWWRMADGALLQTIGVRPNNVYSAALSPDASLVAVGTYVSGYATDLRQTSDGALMGAIPASNMPSAVFAGNGRHLATQRWAEKNVEIWSLSDTTRQQSLPSGATLEPNSLAFTPDGLYVIAKSYDGSLCFWRWHDALPARVYAQEANPSWSGAWPCFSPDGTCFAYGRSDATLVLARNPFSALRVTALQSTGGLAAVAWEGGNGHYQLESSTSLVSGTWQPLGPPQTTTSATNLPVTPPAYYRLRGL
ncbi:MAG: WD40 repeat domain-containing protein [Lentisphaerae bacterium]|nr:WD40 repeat domain-containing protein [Lentisphaerota bacterium]